MPVQEVSVTVDFAGMALCTAASKVAPNDLVLVIVTPVTVCRTEMAKNANVGDRVGACVCVGA